MVLHIYIANHLANSAGMRKSGPVKTGPTGVVDIPLLLELTSCDGIKLEGPDEKEKDWVLLQAPDCSN